MSFSGLMAGVDMALHTDVSLRQIYELLVMSSDRKTLDHSAKRSHTIRQLKCQDQTPHDSQFRWSKEAISPQPFS